jgi:hypothetical protein
MSRTQESVYSLGFARGLLQDCARWPVSRVQAGAGATDFPDSRKGV